MKLKRALKILLTVSITVAMLAGVILPVGAVEPSDYWTDTGNVAATTPDYDSTTKTYTIDNAGELAWVAALINNDPYNTYRTCTFRLSADIELAGHFWVPIGKTNRPFTGTFDGNGKTISNMTIGTAASPSTLDKAGLFGYADGAVIENVNMTYVSVNDAVDSATFLDAGGVAGLMLGGSISNCTVSGAISGNCTLTVSSSRGVGGIVGLCDSITIANCTSSVNIAAGGSGLPVGGLAGGVGSADIANCSASGSISGAGVWYGGGLCGNSNGGTISNCYATGDVTGSTYSDVGGLIGVSYANVTNCFSTGNVSGEDSVGGFIGVGRGGNISNCFSTGNATSAGVVGGFVGESAYDGLNSVTNCYAAGDITTTQTNVINQAAGGLIGYMDTGKCTVITNAYWNRDALQTVGGTARASDARVGIDCTTDVSTAKSWDEMTDTAFVALLNVNKGDAGSWTSVCGLNGGYPYLEGQCFPMPPVTYTVTFYSDDGVVYKVIDVAADGTAAAPGTTPTKALDNFAGWYTAGDGSGTVFDFGTAITENTQIYATWTPKPTYSVTYDLNGGTGTVPEDKNTYVEGNPVILASGSGLTGDASIFAGWTLSADGSGTLYAAGATYTMGSSAVVFHAKWTPAYTVTYDPNGGTGTAPVDNQLYTHYQHVILASGSGLSKAASRFMGWTENGSVNVLAPGIMYSMGAANVTFHAKWQTTYTVTYDLNGGTGTLPVDSYTYITGEKVTLASGDTLTNGSFHFGGWIDQSGDLYDPENDSYWMYSENVTFRARWTDYWTDEGNVAAAAPSLDADTNTYTIENAAQLAWVAVQVEQGFDFAGYTIKIAEDVSAIDLSAHNWEPIGNNMCFCGNFDGNNKKIVNLRIGTAETPDTELEELGLFGWTQGSSIRNVCLESVAIYSSADYSDIGGLAGYAESSAFSNCSVSGVVSGGYGTWAGGLLGDGYHCSISGCRAAVDVTGGPESCVGGLGNGDGDITVLDSCATGSVSGGDMSDVGGLLGYIYSGVVTNSYATGDTAGGAEASYVGGFIGYNDGTDCQISYGYWNSDARQTIGGTAAVYKVGIGYGPGKESLSPKTSEDVKTSDFAALLEANKNEGTAGAWSVISGVNSGCPVLANTVTFDKNGGDTDAAPATLAVAFGSNVGTLPDAPARSGYTFSGWNSAADGSGTAFTADTAVTADVTVFAHWTVITGGNTTSTGSESTVTTRHDGRVSTSSTQVTAGTGTSSGTASASVDTDTMAALTEQVELSETAGQRAVAEINVSSASGSRAVDLHIPKTAFDNLTDKTDADIRVGTGLGTITFSARAADAISGSAAAGDITVSITRVDSSALSDELQNKVGDRPVYDFSVSAGNTRISGFNDGSVQVSIPYTLRPGENRNAIIVYYIDGNGDLQTVRGRYDATSGTVVFTTTHFSQYMIGYHEVVFSDVEDDAWYAEAVGFISARGITTGTDESHYTPQGLLTRGQFMTMVMRACGIEPDANGTDNFADAGNTYYTGYLAAAKHLGISAGVGDNRFAPDEVISRQQMFTLLYNTLKVTNQLPEEDNDITISAFADSDCVASYAQEAMAYLVKTGMVSGSNGLLLPSETTTRAQMAQVLYNLLTK